MRGALPRYVQISERLIREIAAGRIADGARLPPERDMARDLGVSVGTLRKALAALDEAGLLERVQGSGNYVRHRPETRSVYSMFRLELPNGGGLPTARVLSVDRREKPKGAPRFGRHRQAFRIRRVRLLDDGPVAMEEIWLDAGRAGTVTLEDLADALYLFYSRALGLVITRVEDRIGVGAMPDWADDASGLVPGAACGYVERVSWADDGEACEYSRTWFDPDKARYVSRIGKG